MKPGAEMFLNLAMFTSRTRLIRNNRDSLAKLFVPVTLIRLFFKKWFTYFWDIYVFLLQFRIKTLSSPLIIKIIIKTGTRTIASRTIALDQ